MFGRIYNTIFVLFIKIYTLYVFHVFTFILFATAWKPRFIHKKITSRQMSPLNGAHQIKFRILFRRLIRLMWCIEFLIFTEVEKQVCNFFLSSTNQISYLYCSKNMWATKGKKKTNWKDPIKYHQAWTIYNVTLKSVFFLN